MRIKDSLLVCYAWICVLIILAAVCSLLVFIVWQGGAAIEPALFFGDTSIREALTGQAPVWDGLWPACAGTLVLVFLAAGLALPFGLGCGLYMALLAGGWKKRFCSLCINQLATIPSIIMGLFGFAMILFLRQSFFPHANTCLMLAGICLAVLILPYIVRSTQNAVEAIPPEHRLIGPALGLTLWQNMVHVLLPQAGSGILGGVILAVGRAAEDTAVILLTGVVANAGLPQGVLEPFEALSFTIYYLAAEYRTESDLQTGFGACLVLLVITSLLFASARFIQQRIEKIWF